jgi:hypothetical protein
MKLNPLRSLFLTALPLIAVCLLSRPLMADPPIWANARHVKATYTECGQERYIIFRGNSVRVPATPDPPGCRSVEVFYTQLNIAQAFLGGKNGEFGEANVDAGYISCDGPPPTVGQRGILIIGTPGEIERARREHPAPQGCHFTKQKYQYVSSLGGIPFTDVPNGGTMSVKESLAIHAKEREKAIAECNASPACRAEVKRRTAINTYFECMKPLQPNEPERTCYRPW